MRISYNRNRVTFIKREYRIIETGLLSPNFGESRDPNTQPNLEGSPIKFNSIFVSE